MNTGAATGFQQEGGEIFNLKNKDQTSRKKEQNSRKKVQYLRKRLQNSRK